MTFQQPTIHKKKQQLGGQKNNNITKLLTKEDEEDENIQSQCRIKERCNIYIYTTLLPSLGCLCPSPLPSNKT
jgi:hypothetical protein